MTDPSAHRPELEREREIKTEFVNPPIPVRDCDWSAVFDDYDGAPDAHCPIGRGRTEAEAIKDLLEQEEERNA